MNLDGVVCTTHRSDMRTRILFVDDEPAILTALARMFRRERARWEMMFALGGRRALDEFRRGSFDVVVSDMRMPDIDGATLLSTIRRERPATGRIMLTGYAEEAEIARIRPALHQLLRKPCSVGAIRDAIESHLRTRTPEGADSSDDG